MIGSAEISALGSTMPYGVVFRVMPLTGVPLSVPLLASVFAVCKNSGLFQSQASFLPLQDGRDPQAVFPQKPLCIGSGLSKPKHRSRHLRTSSIVNTSEEVAFAPMRSVWHQNILRGSG